MSQRIRSPITSPKGVEFSSRTSSVGRSSRGSTGTGEPANPPRYHHNDFNRLDCYGEFYSGQRTLHSSERNADKIVLPTIPGNAASGAVMSTSGMKGSEIRGQNHTLRQCRHCGRRIITHESVSAWRIRGGDNCPDQRRGLASAFEWSDSEG